MSCGFGAVILIFIIIHHSTEVTSQEINIELMAEIKKLEEELLGDRDHSVQLKNTLEDTDDRIITTEGMALEVIETLKELKAQVASIDAIASSKKEAIEALKAELQQLEKDTDEIKGSVAGDEAAGRAVRSFVGEGDRQYLTGMKIGGEHILILLDSSASMLDKTIVNVIRRRNMPTTQKLQSPKWQRAIRTVEWVTANMPKDSFFQLFTFNTEARPTIKNTDRTWLKVVSETDLKLSIDNLKKVIPANGTNLEAAFSVVRNMDPQPDNVFLITDSLPTRGFDEPRKTNVASKDRVRFFTESIEVLPAGIPVNVILFPMEGDPLASPSFWQLAQLTGGSFLSPPADWP